MKFVIWIVFCVSVMSVASAANSTRVFEGTANISIINPSETILKVCTPNQKYSMGIGTTTMMRLYVRNDMQNKTVNRVYLEVAGDSRFRFNFTPDHLESITPDSYQYFDVNVTATPELPYGNYQIRFLIGTDEYMVGAFEYPVLVRIVPFSQAIFYGMIIIIAILGIAVLGRTLWTYRMNRGGTSLVRPKRKSRRSVSQKYYKR